MNKTIYSIAILLLFQFACKKDNGSDGGSFTVRGSTNVVNAGVTLQGTQVYQTTANNVGDFTIENVAEDNYTLIVTKESADSSFISNNMQVNVNSDTVLATLLLPDPVKLYQSNNIGSNSINWSWTKFNLPAYFYEYKVYRKKDRGLDETTGELVYVGTDINDTVFTDDGLLESTEYYYRVYVTNKFGKLGGSNIQHAKTTPGNLVTNSSFELFNSDNSPILWKYNFVGNIIEDNTAPDGNHILQLSLIQYHYALNFGDIYQPINVSKLLPNVLYKLSAKVKVVQLEGNAECWIGFTEGSEYQTQILKINNNTPKNAWITVSNDFYAASQQSGNLNILAMCNIPYANEPYKVLVDDIKIQKAE